MHSVKARQSLMFEHRVLAFSSPLGWIDVKHRSSPTTCFWGEDAQASGGFPTFGVAGIRHDAAVSDQRPLEQAEITVGFPDGLEPGKVFVRFEQETRQTINHLEFLSFEV